MKDQKKEPEEKLHKIIIELQVKYAPDKGEVRSILKDLKISLAKNLISMPTWGMKLKIECRECGFIQIVNPNQKKKLNWFCRHCGKVILYDILG
jgi:ribosomal protein S27E